MDAAEFSTDTRVAVYMGGREILASGTTIVTPGAPPLVVCANGEVRVIHFDLFPEFRRSDGVIVGGRQDEHSIAPEETKTASIGDASITYTLDAFRPDVMAHDAVGRWGPASYVLIWEVWRDAPGMNVPAPPKPDARIAMRDPSCLV